MAPMTRSPTRTEPGTAGGAMTPPISRKPPSAMALLASFFTWILGSTPHAAMVKPMATNNVPTLNQIRPYWAVG